MSTESDSSDPFSTWDGVYVLGALSEDDRTEYERHLEGCAECRTAVAGVRALTASLAGAPASAFEPVAEDPPETLLPGLLRRARRRRTGRRWLVGSVAAAAAAILVITAGVIGYQRGQQPTVADASVMTAVVKSPVTARVTLTAATGGAVVSMWCTYDAVADSKNDYVLLVRTRTGGAERLAAWPGIPDQTFMVRVPTRAAAKDITSVEVTNAAGKVLLRFTP